MTAGDHNRRETPLFAAGIADYPSFCSVTLRR
jgi:hypothetical protein